jgi:NIPSNAP
VIYRMRIYDAVTENLPAFHQFFRAYLLPVQFRHGARLVDRWETSDSRVVAIWEYDDQAAYERIEAAVRHDPDARRAQEIRAGLPPLIKSQEEIFMTSTMNRPADS